MPENGGRVPDISAGILNQPRAVDQHGTMPRYWQCERSSNYDVGMNLGFPEMTFIFLMALIIFGPRKLPEIGRQIGKAMAEFKRYSNDFKYQLETEVRQWEIEETLRKEKDSLKEVLNAPPEGTVASKAAASELAASASTSPDVAPIEPSTVESPNSILPPKGSDA